MSYPSRCSQVVKDYPRLIVTTVHRQSFSELISSYRLFHVFIDKLLLAYYVYLTHSRRFSFCMETGRDTHYHGE